MLCEKKKDFFRILYIDQEHIFLYVTDQPMLFNFLVAIIIALVFFFHEKTVYTFCFITVRVTFFLFLLSF